MSQLTLSLLRVHTPHTDAHTPSPASLSLGLTAAQGLSQRHRRVWCVVCGGVNKAAQAGTVAAAHSAQDTQRAALRTIVLLLTTPTPTAAPTTAEDERTLQLLPHDIQVTACSVLSGEERRVCVLRCARRKNLVRRAWGKGMRGKEGEETGSSSQWPKGIQSCVCTGELWAASGGRPC